MNIKINKKQLLDDVRKSKPAFDKFQRKNPFRSVIKPDNLFKEAQKCLEGIRTELCNNFGISKGLCDIKLLKGEGQEFSAIHFVGQVIVGTKDEQFYNWLWANILIPTSFIVVSNLARKRFENPQRYTPPFFSLAQQKGQRWLSYYIGALFLQHFDKYIFSFNCYSDAELAATYLFDKNPETARSFLKRYQDYGEKGELKRIRDKRYVDDVIKSWEELFPHLNTKQKFSLPLPIPDYREDKALDYLAKKKVKFVLSKIPEHFHMLATRWFAEMGFATKEERQTELKNFKTFLKKLKPRDVPKIINYLKESGDLLSQYENWLGKVL